MKAPADIGLSIAWCGFTPTTKEFFWRSGEPLQLRCEGRKAPFRPTVNAIFGGKNT